MNQVLGTFKQIGATLIILVIIVMMGITFSSQPRHEILSILSGGDRIGEFRGEEIRPELYHLVAEQCKGRYQIYGNVPEVFIQQCVSDNLKHLMILPAIALDSGLDASEKSIQDSVLAEVRQRQVESQGRLLEEDRMTAEQLYRQTVTRTPIELRRRLARIDQFQMVYGRPFPVAEAELSALSRAAASRLDMEVVAFTNSELLSRFSAEATDEEMRGLYEKDKKEAEAQAKKEGVNRPYPPFETRKDFLKERVLAEKKKKQLEDLKTSLGSMAGDAALEKVGEAVHVRPERVQARLGSLDAVALASGRRLNLTGSHLLADLVSKDGLKGPYQDGETTVYLRVLKLEPAPAVPEKPGSADNRRMMLAGALFNNMVDDYAKTGKFKLKSAAAQNEEK